MTPYFVFVYNIYSTLTITLSTTVWVTNTFRSTRVHVYFYVGVAHLLWFSCLLVVSVSHSFLRLRLGFYYLYICIWRNSLTCIIAYPIWLILMIANNINSSKSLIHLQENSRKCYFLYGVSIRKRWKFVQYRITVNIRIFISICLVWAGY